MPEEDASDTAQTQTPTPEPDGRGVLNEADLPTGGSRDLDDEVCSTPELCEEEDDFKQGFHVRSKLPTGGGAPPGAGVGSFGDENSSLHTPASLDALTLHTQSAAVYAPLPPSQVVPFLQVFHYAAADTASWLLRPGTVAATSSDQPPPRVELRVDGHGEVGGHTWYTVLCAVVLRKGGHTWLRNDWEVLRRLTHMRKHLHDPVKQGMGKGPRQGDVIRHLTSWGAAVSMQAYHTHFGRAPFANRGGIAGTSARLHYWLEALASCINSGNAPPAVVAATLHFLDAPSFQK